MSRPIRYFNLAARQTLGRRNATTPSIGSAAVKKQAEGVAGKATAFVEPIIYYARVGLQFVRAVGVHQKVALPSIDGGISGISNFAAAFRNGAWKKVTLRQTGQLAIEGVKVSGFFLVGEMIGRGSVIGYQIPGADNHDDAEAGGH
ncbi:hypothetical protein HDU87_005314 [Geranomyces variabilis]|uniref:Uncharacterized protein n=1 Tax=Geranomyces variabilis TaxID=109894 RepID=A0AAD5THA1_9FUNG|nr:hypothetical protein HDU87_005314 [Geranomyces variabilis]